MQSIGSFLPIIEHSTQIESDVKLKSQKKKSFCFLFISFRNLGKKEHKSEEYLRKFPKGKVPAMEDDGFLLAESHAIM